jgi:hypothetical protein
MQNNKRQGSSAVYRKIKTKNTSKGTKGIEIYTEGQASTPKIVFSKKIREDYTDILEKIP